MHNRIDVKKEIFDKLKPNRDKPINDFADEFIRVNRRTYDHVEVSKNRNGRTLYAPILPNGKLDISFGAETPSPKVSDSEEASSKPMEDELIEVEYPRVKNQQSTTNIPNIKVKVNIEIIQPKLRDNRTGKKSYQLFKSCLIKDEFIR